MKATTSMDFVTRPPRVLLTALAGLCAVSVALLAVGLSSATAASEKIVSVPGNQPWTDTGVALTQGEAVTISASGTIKWGSSSPLDSPVGRTFGQLNGKAGTCGSVAYAGGSPFPAPGVNCYSMLFKIGSSGIAFPTGKKISFTSPVAGELFLGVNDTFFGDNTGSWSATITTP